LVLSSVSVFSVEFGLIAIAYSITLSRGCFCKTSYALEMADLDDLLDDIEKDLGGSNQAKNGCAALQPKSNNSSTNSSLIRWVVIYTNNYVQALRISAIIV